MTMIWPVRRSEPPPREVHAQGTDPTAQTTALGRGATWFSPAAALVRGIPSKRFRTAWLILWWGFAGVVTAHAQSTVLITWTNTVWKFRPNTNAPAYSPADAWTAVAFDDSSWLTGQGLFGYETFPD